LLSGSRLPLFEPKHLPWLITAVVALGAFGYLIFFR
jgi:hypothetical protein